MWGTKNDMAMMVLQYAPMTWQTPGLRISSSLSTMFNHMFNHVAIHNVMDQDASTSWMTVSRYLDLQGIGFRGTSGTQFQPEMAMVLKARIVKILKNPHVTNSWYMPSMWGSFVAKEICAIGRVLCFYIRRLSYLTGFKNTLHICQ